MANKMMSRRKRSLLLTAAIMGSLFFVGVAFAVFENASSSGQRLDGLGIEGASPTGGIPDEYVAGDCSFDGGSDQRIASPNEDTGTIGPGVNDSGGTSTADTGTIGPGVNDPDGTSVPPGNSGNDPAPPSTDAPEDGVHPPRIPPHLPSPESPCPGR